jgi:Uma2 family endonuclease
MSSAPSPYITPEQYLEMEEAAFEKSEYIDGQIFAMSGAASPHNQISSNLNLVLRTLLKGRDCRVWGPDQRVHVEASNAYFYPDLVVVCGERKYSDSKQMNLLNPTTIVEILSPSTERFDLGDKFLHYQKIESLQEYVLVRQNQPIVRRYAKSKGQWVYNSIMGLESKTPLILEDSEVSLADIYEDVDFPPPSVNENRPEYRVAPQPTH